MRRRMTVSQTARRAKLQARLSATRDAVFSAAPSDDVPFLACLDIAAPHVRAAYLAARDALDDLDSELVADLRGYRDRFGNFTPY